MAIQKSGEYSVAAGHPVVGSCHAHRSNKRRRSTLSLPWDVHSKADANCDRLCAPAQGPSAEDGNPHTSQAFMCLVADSLHQLG